MVNPMNIVATASTMRGWRAARISARATGTLTLTAAGEAALLAGRPAPARNALSTREGAASVPDHGRSRKLQRAGAGSAATGWRAGRSLSDLIRRHPPARRLWNRRCDRHGARILEWRYYRHLEGHDRRAARDRRDELVRGTLDFAGRSFNLEQGKDLPTGDAYDPAINLLATDTFDNAPSMSR